MDKTKKDLTKEFCLAILTHYRSLEFTQTNVDDHTRSLIVDNETVVNGGFDKLFLFVSNNARDFKTSSICGDLFSDKGEAFWEIPYDSTNIRFFCKATDIYTDERVTALYEECINAKVAFLNVLDSILSDFGLKDTIFDTNHLKEYLENAVDEFFKGYNGRNGIYSIISYLTNETEDKVNNEVDFYFERDNFRNYNRVVYETICKEMLKFHNFDLKEEEHLNIEDYKTAIFNSLVESVRATFEIKEAPGTFEPNVLIKTISKLLKDHYQVELQKYVIKQKDKQEDKRKADLRNKIEQELNDTWKSANVKPPANAKELVEKEFEIRNEMHVLMKNNVDMKEEDARKMALEQLIAERVDKILKDQQQKITKEQATTQAKTYYGFEPDKDEKETLDKDETTKEKKEKGLSGGKIAAIVIGSILGVILIAMGLYYMFVVMKKKNKGVGGAKNRNEAI